HSRSDIRVFEVVLNEIDSNIKYTPFDKCKKALDYLASSNAELPDYIFLDVNMPEINGIECLQQIRKNKKLDDIQVIMYSNDPVKNYHDQTKLLNTQCLRKSIDFNKTCKEVAAILHIQA